MLLFLKNTSGLTTAVFQSRNLHRSHKFYINYHISHASTCGAYPSPTSPNYAATLQQCFHPQSPTSPRPPHPSITPTTSPQPQHHPDHLTPTSPWTHHEYVRLECHVFSKAPEDSSLLYIKIIIVEIYMAYK